MHIVNGQESQSLFSFLNQNSINAIMIMQVVNYMYIPCSLQTILINKSTIHAKLNSIW